MIPASTPEAQFTDWLEEHGAIVRKLSLAYAPMAADTADLHQEMLVQLWRSLPRFQGQAKVSTWIYRVCLNTALTWRRGENRRLARIVAEPAPLPVAASEHTGPAEVHARRDLHDQLLQAVRMLPPAERTVCVLALDGLAYAEIAQVTGMTENHVGVALSRARQKLSQIMKGISDEL